MNKVKVCGIYCIENIVNGKKYIGQSVDIYHRFINHKCELIKGTNSKYLQNSFCKYGIDNFIFYIIEECLLEELDIKEIYYISFYDTINQNFGYNILEGGNKPPSQKGIPKTDETKKKMSDARIGIVFSDETKKKMSEARKILNKNNEYGFKKGVGGKWNGKFHKQETKEKLSKANIGIKRINSSSVYVGVSLDKGGKWISRINYMDNAIYIGIYFTETEAALAYNEVAIEYYGWNARLNIIPQEEIDKLWEYEGETIE